MPRDAAYATHRRTFVGVERVALSQIQVFMQLEVFMQCLEAAYAEHDAFGAPDQFDVCNTL